MSGWCVAVADSLGIILLCFKRNYHRLLSEIEMVLSSGRGRGQGYVKISGLARRPYVFNNIIDKIHWCVETAARTSSPVGYKTCVPCPIMWLSRLDIRFMPIKTFDIRFLRVNFDPLIVRLLREVKYFLLLGLRVPESALEVFDRGEVKWNRDQIMFTQRGTWFHW